MRNNIQQEPAVQLPLTSQFKTLLKWIKRLFTVVAVVFLIYTGWHSRTILATVFANAQLHYIILAIVMLMIAHLVAPFATVVILKICDSSLSYQFALKTHLNRLPARYLPGGIWHTVGRMVDFYTHGIKSVHLTVLVLLEHILGVGISFTVGGCCLWYFRGTTDYWGILAVFALITSVIGLILTPILLKWQLSVSHLIYHLYIKSISIYFGIWMLLASAFVCYLLAFPLIRNEISILEMGGTYMFSWGVGFIAIFAPQGVGVFELVAGHLINVPISLGSTVVLIAGFRVVMLLADMTIWLLSRVVLLFLGRLHHN